MVLPSYATVTQAPQSVARYEAILDAVDPSLVGLVDGVALFDGQPDKPGLFTLRIDNHPSERGHAVLADAVIAAFNRGPSCEAGDVATRVETVFAHVFGSRCRSAPSCRAPTMTYWKSLKHMELLMALEVSSASSSTAQTRRHAEHPERSSNVSGATA